MSRKALPCIICGVELDEVFDDTENQPSEGTVFHSRGHYGSTAFDPMDASQIEITICDKCLTLQAELGRVLWSRYDRWVRWMECLKNLRDDVKEMRGRMQLSQDDADLLDGDLSECDRPDPMAPLVPWKPGLDRPTEAALDENAGRDLDA